MPRLASHSIEPYPARGDFGRTIWKCFVCRGRIHRVGDRWAHNPAPRRRMSGKVVRA